VRGKENGITTVAKKGKKSQAEKNGLRSAKLNSGIRGDTPSQEEIWGEKEVGERRGREQMV